MKCLAVAVFSIFFLFFSPLKAAALPAEEFQDTADHLPAPFDISAGGLYSDGNGDRASTGWSGYP